MNGADWRQYFSLRIFEKKLDSQKINPYFFLVIRKLGQIEKIVSFSERGSLTENNGTIIKKFFLKKKFQNWDSKCHFSTDF